MPLKTVFLRPQNRSRLNPITKALLPPSRIWWSECPGSVPGINSGRPRDCQGLNGKEGGRMSGKNGGRKGPESAQGKF